MTDIEKHPIVRYFPATTIIMIGILIGMQRIKVDMNKVYNLEYFYENQENIIIGVKFLVFFSLLLGIAYLLAIGWSKVYTYFKKRYILQQNLIRERNQLIRFYHAMNGTQWRDHTRWCSNEPINKWYGVKIDGVSGRVTKLILPENNLSGEIPEDFFHHFIYLNELDLRMNKLTGPLPNDIVYCKRLEGIYLYDNQLTGEIPAGLAELKYLTGIYLFNNKFTNVESSKTLFQSKYPPDSCYIYL